MELVISFLGTCSYFMLHYVKIPNLVLYDLDWLFKLNTHWVAEESERLICEIYTKTKFYKIYVVQWLSTNCKAAGNSWWRCRQVRYKRIGACHCTNRTRARLPQKIILQNIIQIRTLNLAKIQISVTVISSDVFTHRPWPRAPRSSFL